MTSGSSTWYTSPNSWSTVATRSNVFPAPMINRVWTALLCSVTVGGTAVTVPLTNVYMSPVVVCSVQVATNTLPVLPRLSVATASK